MTSIWDNLVGDRDAPVAGGGGGPVIPPPPEQAPATRPQKPGYHIRFAPIPGLTPHPVFKGKPFLFQCGPLNEFGESSSYNFQDYGTLSAGQHSQRVGRNLRTVSFDTLFVDYSPYWALVHLPAGKYPAQKAKETLQALHDQGQPFRFTVSQPKNDRPEVDYAATLRGFVWKQVAGETDTYYCSLQLVEFRTPDIEVYLKGKKHKHHPHLPVTLEIRKLPSNRDTLHKLAKFYYGDPSKARVIAVFNHIKHFPFSEKLTEKHVRRKKITVPVIKKAQGVGSGGGGGGRSVES